MTMWLLFTFGMVGMILIRVGTYISDNHRSKSLYGVSVKDSYFLSNPARKVLAAYNSLPLANRPDGDMLAILQALDTKYLIDTVNDHHYHIDFRCLCRDESCPMPEYNSLRDSIEDIAEAVREQESALRAAAVANQLDMAKQVVEQMKQEKQIINDVTHQLGA